MSVISESLKPSAATGIIADIIGGFPQISPRCNGCGKLLLLENAWMTDGCPCNTPLGVNSMNETRWRLLMQLQQQQSAKLEDLASYNQYMEYHHHPTALMVEGNFYPTAWEVWFQALDTVSMEVCGRSVGDFCDGSEEVPSPERAIRCMFTMLSNAMFDAGLHQHEMTADGLANIAKELVALQNHPRIISRP